ncbi:HEAT repeat domain-containing protein [Microcoleus sp. AR_TQ3_B6]|uniref:HEAT repeat domain-containing protein n=1 Tax=Microcoleus sp. AR_TQ3_B6 TaxID=3055284 RepID=UPI002FD358FE
MIDPVSAGLGWLLVGPILQELAKAALDDYVKDFFKDCIKDVEGIAKKPFAQNAVLGALTDFLIGFEEELERSGLDKKQIRQYLQPLKQFVKQPPLPQVLGSAFQRNCQVLNTAILADSWQTLTLQHPLRRNLPTLTRLVPSNLLKDRPTPSLPLAFSWEQVAEKYLASVKLIIQQNAELREILNAENLDGIVEPLTDSDAIPADFNLESYQQKRREQDEYLNLGNLDTRSGDSEEQLTVRENFIPHAQSENNSDVVISGVQEIAPGWKDDPDTLPNIKQRAQYDDDWTVRLSALQELVRAWKDDPETLPILKQLAQYDDDSAVRLSALQELVWGWKNDSETLPWLKQLAQSEDNWDVRRAAVQEIAREWKDDPETLPWLKQRAQSDDDANVRRAAVQELARGWKDESGIFELLGDVAIHDPFDREDEWQDNPRQAALAATIELYADRPETLELVRDRAQNDRDPKLREFAQEKLTQLEGK